MGELERENKGGGAMTSAVIDSAAGSVMGAEVDYQLILWRAPWRAPRRALWVAPWWAPW